MLAPLLPSENSFWYFSVFCNHHHIILYNDSGLVNFEAL